MRLTIPTAAAVLALLAVTGARAEPTTYRCTDAQGQVSYTQTPADLSHCEPLTARGYVVKPTPKPPAPPAKKPPAPAPQPPPSKTNGQTARAKNCKISRHNLQILESDQPVVQTDANGKQSVLDAEQRKQALTQTRKDIDYWCH